MALWESLGATKALLRNNERFGLPMAKDAESCLHDALYIALNMFKVKVSLKHTRAAFLEKRESLWGSAVEYMAKSVPNYILKTLG